MSRFACAIGLVSLLLLIAHPATADVVVLRTGEKYSGVIANREAVLKSPTSQRQVAILLEGSEDLMRFDAELIEYLLLEDDGERTVIDMTTAQQPPVVSARPIVSEAGDGGGGVELMVCGLLLGATGLLVKFGDEKATVTNTSIDYDEKSYNELNYLMMGLGGVMFVIGAGMEAGGGWASASTETGPLLAVRSHLGERWALIGYRVAF